MNNTSQDNQREAAEIGYTAGLIDGEGYISLSRQKPNGLNKTERYQVKVGVKMCSESVIKRMHKVHGGKIYQRVAQKTHWKSYWEWHINTKSLVREFLEDILPYLIEKKERAELMIKFIEDSYERTNPVSDEELLRRQAYFIKMKRLNTRGAPATTNRENTREGEVIV